MRAAKIGVIDDIDVARLRCRDFALADQSYQLGGGVLHCADEDRQAAGALGNQRAIIGGIDSVRPVIRLSDYRREGGA
jgi:hypothetical protein